MSLPSAFSTHSLGNRLGQLVELAVHHCQISGREYIFVSTITQQASSLVAKNAEYFAAQLRELFKLEARRFEMVELRSASSNPEFWRWRFEWVGNSPVSPRSELVTSVAQQNQFFSLLNFQNKLQSAAV